MMANPDPVDLPMSVLRWQAELLARIRFLAGEHSRVQAAGWANFEPREPGEDPRAAWRAGLDVLEAQREHAEQSALSAGAQPVWIADARTLGALSAHQRPDRDATAALPARADPRQAFCMDMLSLDLWHLQRMAAVAAARAGGQAEGRWSLGAQPRAELRFGQNMSLHRRRVTALARAAEITPAEGDRLWGPGAEGARRAHAQRLTGYDELSVAHEWNYYAQSRTDLTVPPYAANDPATAPRAAVPPSPRRFLDAATATAHRISVEVAAAYSDSALDAGVLTAAIDSALSGGHDRWPTQTDEPTNLTAGDRSPGIESDPY
ncbi:hypothetical protein [Nocardia sp. NPDC057227]|uniref:hypothetical protein n=1 Tax=Nocardia sp. NPDC057227 TaxID=3346056 RepID=UPI0036417FFB